MHAGRIHDGIWAVIETQMPLEECEKSDINKKGRCSRIYTGRVFFVLIVVHDFCQYNTSIGSYVITLHKLKTKYTTLHKNIIRNCLEA